MQNPLMTCVHDTMAYQAALHRARADFLEMPGLRLTLDQARRLWMLDPAVCDAVLEDLVGMDFLERIGRDTFRRAGA